MKYLLDTNIWYRAAAAAHTLPTSAREILSHVGASFGLSDISLWEIGKKVQLRKLNLNLSLGEWLEQAVASNVRILPLTPSIVADAMGLESLPTRDPADELIVATARVYNLTLLTTDSKLRGYPRASIRYFKPQPENP